MSLHTADPFDPHEPSYPEDPDSADPFDPMRDDHHPAVVLAYSLSRRGYHCEAVVMLSGEVKLVCETELAARGAERYLSWSNIGVERVGTVLKLRMGSGTEEERRAA